MAALIHDARPDTDIVHLADRKANPDGGPGQAENGTNDHEPARRRGSTMARDGRCAAGSVNVGLVDHTKSVAEASRASRTSRPHRSAVPRSHRGTRAGSLWASAACRETVDLIRHSGWRWRRRLGFWAPPSHSSRLRTLTTLWSLRLCSAPVAEPRQDRGRSVPRVRGDRLSQRDRRGWPARRSGTVGRSARGHPARSGHPRPGASVRSPAGSRERCARRRRE